MQVAGVNQARLRQTLAQKGDEAVPEGAAVEDEGKACKMACLHGAQRLEEFVQRAKPAGKDDKGRGGGQKGRLARRELREGDGDIQIGVWPFLACEPDGQTDGARAAFTRPAIGRFHDTGTAASDNGK